MFSPANRLVNLKLTLLDGAYHDVDSSEMAFKVAGSQALKEAARKAGGPVILEPLMAVEVTTPEDYMGEVIGDLNSRRGQIKAMEERSGARVVKALVPLSEMFVTSVTCGRRPRVARTSPWCSIPTRGSRERLEGNHRQGDRRVTSVSSAEARPK